MFAVEIHKYRLELITVGFMSAWNKNQPFIRILVSSRYIAVARNMRAVRNHRSWTSSQRLKATNQGDQICEYGEWCRPACIILDLVRKKECPLAQQCKGCMYHHIYCFYCDSFHVWQSHSAELWRTVPNILGTVFHNSRWNAVPRVYLKWSWRENTFAFA